MGKAPQGKCKFTGRRGAGEKKEGKEERKKGSPPRHEEDRKGLRRKGGAQEEGRRFSSLRARLRARPCFPSSCLGVFSDCRQRGQASAGVADAARFTLLYGVGAGAAPGWGPRVRTRDLGVVLDRDGRRQDTIALSWPASLAGHRRSWADRFLSFSQARCRLRPVWRPSGTPSRRSTCGAARRLACGPGPRSRAGDRAVWRPPSPRP